MSASANSVNVLKKVVGKVTFTEADIAQRNYCRSVNIMS
jgi:hypothetical protein